jgi:hypothetical protein
MAKKSDPVLRNQCALHAVEWLERINDHTDAMVAADWFQERADVIPEYGDIDREWRWVGEKGQLPIWNKDWYRVDLTVPPDLVKLVCTLGARRVLLGSVYEDFIKECGLTSQIRDVHGAAAYSHLYVPCECGSNLPPNSRSDVTVNTVMMKPTFWGKSRSVVWNGECNKCGRRYYGTK